MSPKRAKTPFTGGWLVIRVTLTCPLAGLTMTLVKMMGVVRALFIAFTIWNSGGLVAPALGLYAPMGWMTTGGFDKSGKTITPLSTADQAARLVWLTDNWPRG